MDVDGQIRLAVWIIDNAPIFSGRQQIKNWCSVNIWAWDSIPRSKKNEIIDDYEFYFVVDDIDVPTKPMSFVDRFKARLKQMFRRDS